VVSHIRVACLVALGALCGQSHAQRCAMDVPRFEDNGDGTVTDRRSRLTWVRCSAMQTESGKGCTGAAGTFTWDQARAYAAGVNQAGVYFFNDWRLPSLRELATMTERGCDNPRVDPDVFPGTPAAFYWTASARPGDSSPDRAYALGFGAQGVDLMDKNDSIHVRLVRDAR
jgi:hypothetical protein